MKPDDRKSTNNPSTSSDDHEDIFWPFSLFMGGANGRRANRSQYLQSCGLIGFLIGAPLSYYFQSGILRMQFSLAEYFTHINEFASASNSQNGQPIIVTLVVTCIIGAVIGMFVGNLIDRSKNNNA